MNIRYLIENIVWTVVFLVSCFSAGYIIRPRFDDWKNNKKHKNNSNTIKGDNETNEKTI